MPKVGQLRAEPKKTIKPTKTRLIFRLRTYGDPDGKGNQWCNLYLESKPGDSRACVMQGSIAHRGIAEAVAQMFEKAGVEIEREEWPSDAGPDLSKR